MTEEQRTPSRLKAVCLIAAPCIGIGLVYLFSGIDAGGVLTGEMIETASQVGYVLFGFTLLYRLICFILLDWLVGSMKHRPLPGIIRNLLGIAMALVAIFVAINLVFSGVFAYILTLSSVIGVVIGLALRPIILDIFSGVSTHLDSAFQIGDWIEVHETVDKVGYCGYVEQINWRTTLIRTKTGNFLICPNSLISTAMITNYSRPNRFSRFEIDFKLPARVDTKLAQRLIQTAAEATLNHEIGPTPEMPIRVYVLDLREAAVYYVIRFWIDRAKHSHKGTRHRILQSVMQHLNIAGIPLAEDVITNLNYELSEKPDHALSRREILSRIELFKGIEDARLGELADRLESLSYEAGEMIVTQGDEDDDSMFILTLGGVEVVVDVEGSDLVVDTMQAGDYFGEMSLLTDSPRTASIRAMTTCQVFRISREDITVLIRADRSIMDLLSLNLAERNLNRSRKVQTARDDQIKDRKQSIAAAILDKMKAVFG